MALHEAKVPVAVMPNVRYPCVFLRPLRSFGILSPNAHARFALDDSLKKGHPIKPASTLDL